MIKNLLHHIVQLLLLQGTLLYSPSPHEHLPSLLHTVSPDMIKWSTRYSQKQERYLQELRDTLREILVALDIQLQLVESGRQRRWPSTLITAEEQPNQVTSFH